MKADYGWALECWREARTKYLAGRHATPPARATYDQQMINWLEGIRDHTDNDTEYDLLSHLITSVEEGEHIDDPVPADPNWAPPPGEDPPF